MTACNPRTVLPSFTVLLMTNYLQNRFSRTEMRHKHSTHVPVYLTRFKLILIIFQTACCTSVLPHWKETSIGRSCFFFCSIKGGGRGTHKSVILLISCAIRNKYKVVSGCDGSVSGVRGCAFGGAVYFLAEAWGTLTFNLYQDRVSNAQTPMLHQNVHLGPYWSIRFAIVVSVTYQCAQRLPSASFST